MRVDQITKADYDRRVLPWFQRAVNDPLVHPFLSTGFFRATPEVEGSDWNSAKFMDATDAGLLSASFDHERKSASIGLWVLGGETHVAAALMRYAIRQIPRRYGMKYLTFLVAESNTAWRRRTMRSAAKFMWGKEPGSVYDIKSGDMVAALHFKIPVDQIGDIFEERRVDRRRLEERLAKNAALGLDAASVMAFPETAERCALWRPDDWPRGVIVDGVTWEIGTHAGRIVRRAFR